MVLKQGEYKIVIQPERSIIVNKKDKEIELAKLKVNLNNIEVTKEEKETWASEELEKRRAMYLERLKETQEILDKING